MDNEEQSGGDGQVQEKVYVPKTLGNLYEGEEAKSCPRCLEGLMWYFLPNRHEIQMCSSPKCQYPFDTDDVTEAYQIRSIDHGLKLSSGKSLVEVSNEEPAASTNQDQRALVNQLVAEFLSKPPTERKVKLVETPYADAGGAKYLQSMVNNLEDSCDE